MTHTFNPSTKEAEADISVNSSPILAIIVHVLRTYNIKNTYALRKVKEKIQDNYSA